MRYNPEMKEQPELMRENAISASGEEDIDGHLWRIEGTYRVGQCLWVQPAGSSLGHFSSLGTVRASYPAYGSRSLLTPVILFPC